MLTLPNLDIYKKHPKKLYTGKLDTLNVAKINERLKETDWETILDKQDTELSYNTYQKTIGSILDEISPVKEITISPKKILREKWMTPGLMKCTMKQKKTCTKEQSKEIVMTWAMKGTNNTEIP